MDQGIEDAPDSVPARPSHQPDTSMGQTSQLILEHCLFGTTPVQIQRPNSSRTAQISPVPMPSQCLPLAEDDQP
ncbi:hypothetical protein SNOG_11122 [Parastagonospora nodorum SN15]|uniref:Uncharacterized protein n=1 Tax=Phaeosphaeria nodorum (strain SN15 / ATCC MYA-4574 / FGSC 10173) TaxID=321614 RepID=Q0UAU2_PHANO|nr:hypothetical protein SNOG_11122 [Parastagonospora nodorum SN15]EAT81621.1 hypothetical protein SNOG_11122 [Parastagonospora nodorum SN15]